MINLRLQGIAGGRSQGLTKIGLAEMVRLVEDAAVFEGHEIMAKRPEHLSARAFSEDEQASIERHIRERGVVKGPVADGMERQDLKKARFSVADEEEVEPEPPSEEAEETDDEVDDDAAET